MKKIGYMHPKWLRSLKVRLPNNVPNFTVTLYIFTDCWNSYRNSTKVKKKLHVYSTLFSARWFWWYFRNDRILKSIWKLGRKMQKLYRKWRKIELPKCRFSLIFLKEFPLQNQVKLTFSTMEIFLILRSIFHMEIEFRSFWKCHQNHRTDKVLNLRTSFFMSFLEYRIEFQQSVKMYRVTVKYQSIWYIVRQSYL